MKKYAVKIMLSADDWIYVTEDTRDNCWDLVPVVFNDKKEADKFAKTWHHKYNGTRFVKVVSYES